MNLAFAGMATWEASDGKWHFGYKEVLKATYDSNKAGRRIISRVELGDVLFDAGELPLNDYEVDIELINQRLAELENAIPSLDGYATEDWVNAQGFLKDVPEVDAYTKVQSDARFQPKGNYVKSVNSNLPDSNGNVEIETGSVIDAYTKTESDARYVRGIKVNDGNVNSPDANGIVNLTVSGGDPIEGVVKSLTIDGDVKNPDSNGNISFSLGNFNLFNLEARTINGERHLIKIVNGVEEDLGVFGTGSGEGCERC